MLRNVLLAVTVATVFSAVAVSASQLESVAPASSTCGGFCSITEPCSTEVQGCTCLSFPGSPDGRGLCTVIGPAATAGR